jgi:hypothetical protein
MSESTSAKEGDGVRGMVSNSIVGISLHSPGVAFLNSSSGIWPRAVVGSSSGEKPALGGLEGRDDEAA